MYLKAVNINGFKSFSENTNIDFTNKVNVVVGSLPYIQSKQVVSSLL